MKKTKILLFGVGVVLLYPASYCALRLTKYFVRQEFVTFGCSGQIRDKYSNDEEPIEEGYTSYSFESKRNQIGCGRIQKDSRRFGEAILLPFFGPLGEMEMRMRGFNTMELQVVQSVAVFERLDADSKKVYYHRPKLIEQIPISRKDQTFQPSLKASSTD